MKYILLFVFLGSVHCLILPNPLKNVTGHIESNNVNSTNVSFNMTSDDLNWSSYLYKLIRLLQSHSTSGYQKSLSHMLFSLQQCHLDSKCVNHASNVYSVIASMSNTEESHHSLPTIITDCQQTIRRCSDVCSNSNIDQLVSNGMSCRRCVYTAIDHCIQRNQPDLPCDETICRSCISRCSGFRRRNCQSECDVVSRCSNCHSQQVQTTRFSVKSFRPQTVVNQTNSTVVSDCNPNACQSCTMTCSFLHGTNCQPFCDTIFKCQNCAATSNPSVVNRNETAIIESLICNPSVCQSCLYGCNAIGGDNCQSRCDELLSCNNCTFVNQTSSPNHAIFPLLPATCFPRVCQTCLYGCNILHGDNCQQRCDSLLNCNNCAYTNQTLDLNTIIPLPPTCDQSACTACSVACASFGSSSCQGVCNQYLHCQNCPPPSNHSNPNPPRNSCLTNECRLCGISGFIIADEDRSAMCDNSFHCRRCLPLPGTVPPTFVDTCDSNSCQSCVITCSVFGRSNCQTKCDNILHCSNCRAPNIVN